MTLPAYLNTGRAARLRSETAASHDALDRQLMAAEPFRDRARFAGFLLAQQRFLHHVEDLYGDLVLGAWLPGLPRLSRLRAVEADLTDLDVTFRTQAARLRAAPAEGLGWLYVAEGSRLGGAVLAVEAARLGLGPAFGARHLAPPPAGLAEGWRTFRSRLDAAPSPAAEEDAVLAGALAAFGFVRAAMTESLVAA